MGLLGNSWNDPQSQMIMGLAQGLLSANGSTGLAAGLGNMQGVQQNQIRNKLINAQLDNYQSEIEARHLATMKYDRQQALIASMFGGGGQPEQQPSGAGSSMTSDAGAQSTYGGAPGARQAGGGGLANMTPDMVARLKLGGLDLTDIYKFSQEPQKYEAGSTYKDRNTGQERFIPKVGEGIALGRDGVYAALPGYAGAQASIEGAKALAVQAPKTMLDAAAQINLRKRADGTETPVSALTENPTLQNLLQGLSGGRPASNAPASGAPSVPGLPQHYVNAVVQTESGGNPNAVSPKGARGLMQVMPGTNTAPGFGIAPARDNSEAERTRVGGEYLGKMQERYQDPTLAAIAYNWGPGNTDMWLKGGGDFNKLPKETRDYVSSVMTRSAVGARSGQVAQADPGGAPSYGMTNDQAAAVKFKDKMATNQADVMDKSYTTASDAATNLKGIYESRQAMNSGAFQGAGADLKLSIAKFGDSIGIPINAEKATNTDYLKSTLGTGLLEKAKTLGSNPSNADASRITDIVGSIGKDPNAMRKILDWQESMANRSISLHNAKVDQAEQNGFKGQFDMHVAVPTVDKPAAPGTAQTAPPPQAMKGMVRGGYKFKGGDPSNQANWERQ